MEVQDLTEALFTAGVQAIMMEVQATVVAILQDTATIPVQHVTDREHAIHVE